MIDMLFIIYYFIDTSFLIALLSIYAFHRLKLDKYLHKKILSSLATLITIKVFGKVTWGVGVSVVGGAILPIMSVVVIYETSFWLGVLFIAIGALIEEKSKKYINEIK